MFTLNSNVLIILFTIFFFKTLCKNIFGKSVWTIIIKKKSHVWTGRFCYWIYVAFFFLIGIMLVFFFFLEEQTFIIYKYFCREGKISDLSQADTSYYRVHKIQVITKHHVLLLGFTIITQKPTEICQVSCKNQSHLSTCKQWHKHLNACKQWHKQSSTYKQWHMRSSTCKRWHRRTNQAVTCVTNRTLPCVAHLLPNSYK